jgi:hypothetical protein
MSNWRLDISELLLPTLGARRWNNILVQGCFQSKVKKSEKLCSWSTVYLYI